MWCSTCGVSLGCCVGSQWAVASLGVGDEWRAGVWVVVILLAARVFSCIMFHPSGARSMAAAKRWTAVIATGAGFLAALWEISSGLCTDYVATAADWWPKPLIAPDHTHIHALTQSLPGFHFGHSFNSARGRYLLACWLLLLQSPCWERGAQSRVCNLLVVSLPENQSPSGHPARAVWTLLSVYTKKPSNDQTFHKNNITW